MIAKYNIDDEVFVVKVGLKSYFKGRVNSIRVSSKNVIFYEILHPQGPSEPSEEWVHGSYEEARDFAITMQKVESERKLHEVLKAWPETFI